MSEPELEVGVEAEVEVETHIDQALAAVRAEREAVTDTVDAYERFRERVTAVEPTGGGHRSRTATGGGTHALVDRSGADGCRAVRQAFAETVQPHSTADVGSTEPLLETVAAEFTDAVAAALAPTTATAFTPELKRTLLTAARTRRAETAVLGAALERETEALADARARVETVMRWLVEAEETPLTALAFPALRQRHGRLDAHREDLAELAAARQAFLDGSTTGERGAAIEHRRLAAYLSQDRRVAHPVLVTVARLDRTLETCQRVVRDHLVRRA